MTHAPTLSINAKRLKRLNHTTPFLPAPPKPDTERRNTLTLVNKDQ